MWIVTDEPVLFNTDSGNVIRFDGADWDKYGYIITLNGTPVYLTDFSAEAIDYIHGLAQLLGAVGVPMPPVEPDDKPDPF